MKKTTVVLGILISLFIGCKEVVHFDIEGQPRVLVLNCLLDADSDSVRIDLTETKAAEDSLPWKTFPQAEVLLYEDDVLLGQAQWDERGYFLYFYRVRPEHTYRITAAAPAHTAVWGETTVPERLAQSEMDMSFHEDKNHHNDGYRVECRWQDTPGKRNFYWFGAKYSENNYDDPIWDDPERDSLWWEDEQKGLHEDTINLKHVAFFFTNSSLPDPFNRVFEDESRPEYEYYIRVEDSGLDGRALDFSYEFFRMRARKVRAYMLSTDPNYDAYLKSIMENYENSVSIDNFPLMYHPAYVHTNVHGGAGLVASYVGVEKILTLPNE